jgi:hypothetical protein
LWFHERISWNPGRDRSLFGWFEPLEWPLGSTLSIGQTGKKKQGTLDSNPTTKKGGAMRTLPRAIIWMSPNDTDVVKIPRALFDRMTDSLSFAT